MYCDKHLSVCLLAYLKNYRTPPNFTKFSVHVTVAMAWSSDDSAVCTSGFVDDTMFSQWAMVPGITSSDVGDMLHQVVINFQRIH